jgi:hypothetical protein
MENANKALSKYNEEKAEEEALLWAKMLYSAYKKTKEQSLNQE